MFHGTTHKTNFAWVINRQIFEINLTNKCNLKCPNCQACVGIAPDNSSLPLEAVEKFVEDSIKLKCYWQIIKLTGGEPTLYSDLDAVFSMLKEYKMFNEKMIANSGLRLPVCKFRLLTNGTQLDSLKTIPRWVNIQNQNTLEGRASWRIFESFNVAPIDLPEYENLDEKVFEQLCPRVTKCGGSALGTNGLYYFCVVAYQVDRVFNLNTGLPDLKSLLETRNDESKKLLAKCCKYCGYFKYPRDIIEKQVTSESWAKATWKSY